MQKQQLDKTKIIEDTCNFIGDNGFDRFQQTLAGLHRYFTKNRLDDAILDHLYSVVFPLPTRKGNVLSTFDTNKPIRDFLNDVERVFHDEPKSFACIALMFRGVDKRLPVPLLLLKKLSSQSLDSRMSLDLNHDMNKSITLAYHHDEVVKANPSTIMKICQYPEKDAKALFRNIGQLELSARFYLPRHNTVSPHINRVVIFSKQDPPAYSWHLSDRCLSSLFGCETPNTEALMKSTLAVGDQLPITDLQLWRAITKQWYERRGATWALLSLQAQKRHLVNMIRHGSIGYSQAYTDVPRPLCDELHEIAFDAIMRKIANTFPFLRAECQRQWAERDANHAHWNPLDD